MKTVRFRSHRRNLRTSLEEYGRGIAGGLLFSLPLLYTMEVWHRGFTASPWVLLIFLAATFVLLLGYNRYGGMHPDASRGEIVIDSIEEMGLGLLLSAGILWILGQITAEMPLDEILGKIVIEAMTVAVGVSIGTAQLGSSEEGVEGEEEGSPGQEGEQDEESRSEETSARSDAAEQRHSPEERQIDAWGQLILGFCGAVVVASNVAPTEEMLIIAFSASAAQLLGMMVLSVLACVVVLFCSGFVGASDRVHRGSVFWVAYGIVSSYACALTASALLLWIFGRFDGDGGRIVVAQTVVLAFPASLGASAGRLLIQ